MKVLVVGSGGREHALTWKIKQSPLVKEIFCAPGNGGMEDMAECVDIKANDIHGLVNFARENKIGLTVVGPEVPLVEGIVDRFEEEKLVIFGPKKDAARLEGSKVFSKEFMYDCNIPTAPFRTFDNINEARDFLRRVQFPLVVKADGLASGKGVYICKDIQEARDAINQIMKDKIFNEAGNRIVIEECLEGDEVSILAVCDGEDFILLDSAQDHKRIFDDDLGPNTGGMGAYSPATMLNDDLLDEIESCIIDPVIKGMKKDGTPFRGVLYCGLMITEEGPMVLEFNVRFGDPEIQAILPRLKGDLVEIMLASAKGSLRDVSLDWDEKCCVCVVMSSGGYPGKYEKGMIISGLDKVKDEGDTVVFHAGTVKEGNNFVTSGGRVLGVTSMGFGIESAIKRVYEAVEKIKFDRCFFRRDIGAKAVKGLNVIRR